MKKKVILFQPGVGFYDLVAREIPLGLLSIVRKCPEEYEIVIIDNRVKGWKTKLEQALQTTPLCFGVTSLTGRQIYYGLKVSKFVKDKCNTPIIWGGVHPSLMPEQTLKNEYIDIIIQGEGDESFPQVLKALENGEQLNTIKGIWYKRNGLIHRTSAQSFLDINKLPSLPYYLIDSSNYIGFTPHKFGIMIALEAGRGCIYNCLYCYNPSFNQRRRRILSAEKMVAEITHLKRFFPLDGVYFVDDNFFIPYSRIEKMADLLKSENIHITWSCDADIDSLLDMEHVMLTKFINAGFRFVSIGIESGSPRILTLLNRKNSIDKAVELNKKLRKYNIWIHYNFIAGVITENEYDLKMTTLLAMKLLEENKKANIQTIQALVPYPGSLYKNIASKYGFTEPANLRDWSYFNPEDWLSFTPILDKKRKDQLKVLFISSLFADNKSSLHATKKNIYGILVRLFTLIYKPFARFRLKYYFLHFPIEKILFNFITKTP